MCLLEGGEADDRWCQAVAAELRLSETAFVVPDGDGFRLRWFTPTVEVDLCGHATLATAHVLWETGRLGDDAPARFSTRSGLLVATHAAPDIVLDFPALRPRACDPPAGLADALGAPIIAAARAGPDLLVELATAAAVRDLTPDVAAIAAVDARAVCVTAPADRPAADFVSRVFAPRVGIPEDPVTGSTHCALGPFWTERLGRSALTGEQLSARGGTVRVEVAGDRVRLAGRAVTVWRGELLVR